MPTTIPSHCFARKELHALISRAHQLAKQSEGELATNLTALAGAAANIDGQLAELSDDARAQQRHKDVLDNPYGWESTWVDNTQVIHTDDAKHVIKLSQQILRKTNNEYVVTGRYRLSLDDKTFSTTDRGELRPALVSFMERVAVPDGLRTDLMAFVGVI